MAPKNNNRGENPPAYGEPPQVPEAALRRVNSKPITNQGRRWAITTSNKAIIRASIPAVTIRAHIHKANIHKANIHKANIHKANTASILLRAIMETGVPVERQADSLVVWPLVQLVVAV
ncbi:hypothetical protein J3F83DRAFT_710983 [Trichoderma novae-zelandiae]